MNRPPGPPGAPPWPYPQQPAQPQQAYPQQPYPQQPYPQQGAYPQQAYPQQPYPYPQQQPYPYPQQPAAPRVDGSWAADSAAEKQRNAALGNALAPAGGWGQMSRGRGAMLLGVGVLAILGNVYTIVDNHRFYPKLLVVAPVLFFGGLFMLIAGNQADPRTGQPPAWVKIGYGVSVGGGLFLGILALVLVGC